MILTYTRDDLRIVWPAVLITSLLLILGFARAGIRIFWVAPQHVLDDAPPTKRILPIAAIVAMIAAMAALTVFARPIMSDMTMAAQQLLAPQGYVDAVFNSMPRASAMVTP